MSHRDADRGDSGAIERGRRAADRHESLADRADGRYDVVTTVFDGRVDIGGDGGAVVFDATIRAPALDAVTEEPVADVVEDGWFETLALRLEDVGGALRGDEPAVDVERAGSEVVVRVRISDLDASRAAADAVAAAEYVEGTYVQGIIPGYEYTEPVTHLVQRAADAAGGSRGGTPL
ncbi:DUF5813 family protein [Halobellus sp. GM3]|uniref:DUF5813 family protein n=1 Tax=Halobellus sp. GM3 TaxID=3458410 RepID=UPI00403DA98C